MSQWYAPAFANFDKRVEMTQFLFGDDTQPFWDQPERWPEAGVHVKWVWRKLATGSLTGVDGAAPTTANNGVQTLLLHGGHNVIVVARAASVTEAPSTRTSNTDFINIPNELACYVTFEQRTGAGQVEIADAPINNNFGTVPGQPSVPSSPEFWRGRDQKELRFTNDFGSALNANMAWLCAVLETGR